MFKLTLLLLLATPLSLSCAGSKPEQEPASAGTADKQASQSETDYHIINKDQFKPEHIGDVVVLSADGKILSKGLSATAIDNWPDDQEYLILAYPDHSSKAGPSLALAPTPTKAVPSRGQETAALGAGIMAGYRGYSKGGTIASTAFARAQQALTPSALDPLSDYPRPAEMTWTHSLRSSMALALEQIKRPGIASSRLVFAGTASLAVYGVSRNMLQKHGSWCGFLNAMGIDLEATATGASELGNDIREISATTMSAIAAAEARRPNETPSSHIDRTIMSQAD